MIVHSPQYLNKQMDLLESMGYSTPFALEYVKQTYGIVGKNDRIISLQQINEMRERRFGDKAIKMSRKEYRDEVENLNYYLNKYKGGATAVRMEKGIRKNLVDRIKFLFEDENFDLKVISKFSTKELYDAFREASINQEREYGRQKGTNDTFYEYLLNALEARSQ